MLGSKCVSVNRHRSIVDVQLLKVRNVMVGCRCKFVDEEGISRCPDLCDIVTIKIGTSDNNDRQGLVNKE